MMPCREFVETITTGQEDALSWGRRLSLGTHRLVCHRCRAFEANNRVLDQVLQAHRQRVGGAPPAAEETTKVPVTRP